MFEAVLSKFDNAVLSMVIAIDSHTENIHFYTMNDGDRSTLSHGVESYRSSLFSDDFYEKFDLALKNYREKNPEVSMQKVALVLPNNVFMYDTINIPAIKKQAMANSLTMAINSLYKNHNELKFNNYAIAQNKQYATFSIVGIRKEILLKLKKICEENNVGVQEITLAANSAANTAMFFNPDLKNASFLMVDIKEDKANFSYVVKGKTVGYYHLPFGYSMLYKSRLAPEDLLFDHTTGELLVLNAKEKAKARQLTTIDQTMTLGTADTEFDENETEETSQTEVTFENRNGMQVKKVARKLPKFMLRETPKGKDEYVYENFRIFMKWSQDLFINNPILTSIGTPNKVYVNMPREYDFVYEMANADSEESKITYAPLIASDVYEEEVAKNLELFGGFYVKQFNRVNNF